MLGVSREEEGEEDEEEEGEEEDEEGSWLDICSSEGSFVAAVLQSRENNELGRLTPSCGTKDRFDVPKARIAKQHAL